MHDELQNSLSQAQGIHNGYGQTQNMLPFLANGAPPFFDLTSKPLPFFLPTFSIPISINYVFRISETICTCWYPFCQVIPFLCFNLEHIVFPCSLCVCCWCCWNCLDCAVEEASSCSGARKRLSLHMVRFFHQ